MSIYRYIDVQKYVKVKVDLKNILYILLLSIIVLTTYYIRNNILCLISLIITIVLSIIYNKDIIKSLLIIAKNKLKH